MKRETFLREVVEAAEALLSFRPDRMAIGGPANDAWVKLESAVNRRRMFAPGWPEPQPEPSKIVQISTCFDAGDGRGESGSSYMPAVVTTALCADGSLWWRHHHDGGWVRLPPIPQEPEA
jgi:hypothetical protein